MYAFTFISLYRKVDASKYPIIYFLTIPVFESFMKFALRRLPNKKNGNKMETVQSRANRLFSRPVLNSRNSGQIQVKGYLKTTI